LCAGAASGFRRGSRTSIRSSARFICIRGTARSPSAGPQHQARPRRYPRDRVSSCRPQQLILGGRERPPARTERPAGMLDGPWPRFGLITKKARGRAEGGVSSFCAWSSTGLQMVEDAQTHSLARPNSDKPRAYSPNFRRFSRASPSSRRVCAATFRDGAGGHYGTPRLFRGMRRPLARGRGQASSSHRRR